MRASVVLILGIVGLCWLTRMNGQLFTNCLGFIVCMCVAGLISLQAAANERLTKLRRVLWFKAALLLFFFAAVVATHLPHVHNTDWDEVNKNTRKWIERTHLRGEWLVVSAEQGGIKRPQSELEVVKPKWTFEGKTLSMSHVRKDGGREDEVFTYEIDPTKKPKEIDIVDGNRWRSGIYELAPDELKVCFGERRPKEFKSDPESTQSGILVLKRRE